MKKMYIGMQKGKLFLSSLIQVNQSEKRNHKNSTYYSTKKICFDVSPVIQIQKDNIKLFCIRSTAIRLTVYIMKSGYRNLLKFSKLFYIGVNGADAAKDSLSKNILYSLIIILSQRLSVNFERNEIDIVVCILMIVPCNRLCVNTESILQQFVFYALFSQYNLHICVQ